MISPFSALSFHTLMDRTSGL